MNINRGKVPNIVLVGATGSGKSTISRQLAPLIGFGVFDLDAEIESRAGMPIAQIMEDEGVLGFRDRESEVIADISNIMNHIIVTGAGAIENDANVEKLKKIGPFVWIATPTREIVRRLVMKPDEIRKRPLLAAAVNIEDREERFSFLTRILDETMQARNEVYAQSELVLDSAFATCETNAMLIKTMLLHWGSPHDERDRL